MRSPTTTRRPTLAKVKSFPAPVGGWVANQNKAAPDPRAPRGAEILENWFPTATGCRLRSGSELYATIGNGSDDVTAIFSYKNGATEALFASTATDIYDISSVADPTVSPAAAVSAQTGGDWSVVQFATAGGVFLRLVNGLDTPQVYDGTTWGTTPAITGVTAANLSYVWSHAQRLFFIEKDTLDAWYLGVDLIGGAATKFPMAGVFPLGGSLLFGGTWSLDDTSGLNAHCVFVTTEGEVAIYNGADPASWSLLGLYRIGRPLGPKAFIKAGGDLVIATDIGMIPLSQAINRDMAALAPIAVSYAIEREWNDELAARTVGNWHCAVWPTKQMVVVVPPSDANNDPMMFVANSRTGAWAKYTGWDSNCIAVYGVRMFFGSGSGKIVEAEVGGSDQDEPYVGICVPLFEDLKSPASLKSVMMARAVLLAPAAVNDGLSIQEDYAISLPTAPDEIAFVATNLWGSGVWGTSVWGVDREKNIYQDWRSVHGLAYAIAPALQITSANAAPPDVELVRFDVTFDVADIVT